MLDSNVTVDEISHYSKTSRKKNHIATETSTHVLLEYDTQQCQHNTTTHMKCQKFAPYGND